MQKPAALSIATPIRMMERTDTRAKNNMDEFDDIIELLMDHRCDDSDSTRDLVLFIATACMDDNHLWQDMGLPDRAALNELMQTRFPTLYAKNIGNMKWKKFFYKQLCERADIFICKSPSCGVCTDYNHCFGPEDASS
jgi:nitrogen fixation protein NifQ